MSKSEIKIATFNEVTNAESFSELLQLPVHDEMMPTQLSSSPVKPKTWTTLIQAADNELEKRSTIVYGVPQSTSVNKVEVAADRIRHDIESLEPY